MGSSWAFYILWAALLGLNIYGLYTDLDAQQRKHGGKPVAIVKMASGRVQSRPASEYLWNPSEQETLLYEGDNVATGPNSFVRLAFIGGRNIDLGGNTQIRIRKDLTNGELVLNLLRGSVSAAKVRLPVDQSLSSARDTGLLRMVPTSQGENKSLKITSGLSEFSLQEDVSELAISKARSARLPKVNYARGTVKLKDISKSGHSAAAKSLVPTGSRRLALKGPTRSAVEMVSDYKRDYIPVFDWPKPGSVIWTKGSIKDIGDQELAFQIRPRSNRIPTGYMPYLASPEFEDRSNAQVGKVRHERGLLFASLKNLYQFGTVKKGQQRGHYDLSLKPAALLQLSPSSNEEPIVGDESRFTARSIEPFTKKSLTVILRNAGFSTKLSHYAYSNPEARGKESQLVLPDGKNLFALFPILVGSKYFEFKPGGGNRNPTSGLTIVRGRKVIAVLTGELATEPMAKLAGKALRADFAFIGSPSSFVGGVQEMMKANFLTNPEFEKFYMVADGKLVPINRSFINTDVAVKKFFQTNSNSFFKTEVRLIDL